MRAPLPEQVAEEQRKWPEVLGLAGGVHIRSHCAFLVPLSPGKEHFFRPLDCSVQHRLDRRKQNYKRNGRNLQ